METRFLGLDVEELLLANYFVDTVEVKSERRSR